MLVLEVGSFACLWVVSGSRSAAPAWWQIATSQLASNAFGRVVPGGGAAAGALQYRMLVDAGAPRGATATGLTAANLLTFGVLLGLPLLAVPAILEGRVDAGVRSLLVWAGMILLALIAGGVVLVVTDRPLRRIGRIVQRVRNRLRPRRPPMTGLAGAAGGASATSSSASSEPAGSSRLAGVAGQGAARLRGPGGRAASRRCRRGAVARPAVVLHRAAARPDPDHPGRARIRRGGSDRLARARGRRGRRRRARDTRVSPVLVLAADTARRHQLVALPPPIPGEDQVAPPPAPGG